MAWPMNRSRPLIRSQPRFGSPGHQLASRPVSRSRRRSIAGRRSRPSSTGVPGWKYIPTGVPLTTPSTPSTAAAADVATMTSTPPLRRCKERASGVRTVGHDVEDPHRRGAEVDERRRRGRADTAGTQQGDGAGRRRAEAAVVRPLEPGEVRVEACVGPSVPSSRVLATPIATTVGSGWAARFQAVALNGTVMLTPWYPASASSIRNSSSSLGELRRPRHQVVADVEAEQLSGNRVKRRSQGLVDAVADQRQPIRTWLVAITSVRHRRQAALGDELPCRRQDEAGVLRRAELAGATRRWGPPRRTERRGAGRAGRRAAAGRSRGATAPPAPCG